MVMFAPGGIASLLMMNVRVAAHGLLRRLLASYAALAVTGAAVVAVFAAMVEMVYQIKLNEALGPMMKFAGMELNTRSGQTWAVAVVALLVGVGLFELVRRRFARQWHQIQEEIEARLARVPVV